MERLDAAPDSWTTEVTCDAADVANDSALEATPVARDSAALVSSPRASEASEASVASLVEDRMPSQLQSQVSSDFVGLDFIAVHRHSPKARRQGVERTWCRRREFSKNTRGLWRTDEEGNAASADVPGANE